VIELSTYEPFNPVETMFLKKAVGVLTLYM